MLLGSALDCLLTCEDEFFDVYEVKDFERPTSKLISIIEDNVHLDSIESNMDYFVSEARKIGFGGKSYTDEIIKVKLKELEWYFELMSNKGDKAFITTNEYNEAVEVIKKLKNENPCKNIFNQDVIYQKPLFGEIRRKRDESDRTKSRNRIG